MNRPPFQPFQLPRGPSAALPAPTAAPMLRGPPPKPPGNVQPIPDSAYQETWKGPRPKEVGVRFVSYDRRALIERSAIAFAWEQAPEPDDQDLRTQFFYSHRNLLIAYYGTCDAHDVTKELLQFGEINYPVAFHPRAVTWLFEEVEKHYETGPQTPRATNADIAALALQLLPLEAIVDAVLAKSDEVAEDVPLRSRIIAASLRASIPRTLGEAVTFPPAGTAQDIDLRMRRRIWCVLDDLRPERDETP